MPASYGATRWPNHQEQLWLQFLAQVHFGMQTGGAWYQTATPAISVKLALPAESLPP